MGKSIPLSLSGFCSHLVTSLHVIVNKLFRPRHPRLSAWLRCHKTVFVKVSHYCQEASGSTFPHSNSDWEISLWLQLFPVGTWLTINRTQRQS